MSGTGGSGRNFAIDFSIEIYGTLDAATKEKFSATGFPIKYFDTRLGYSRCRK